MGGRGGVYLLYVLSRVVVPVDFFLRINFNSKKIRVWGIRLIGLNKIQHPKKTSVDCSLNFAYHTRVTQTCGSSETSFRLL